MLGSFARMKRFAYIFGLSAAHFLISFGAFWHSFGSSLGRFDTGEMPSVVDRISDVAVDVLWFPVAPIVERAHFTVHWIEWLLLFANSLLWGCLLYFAILVCGRFFHRNHKSYERPAA